MEEGAKSGDSNGVVVKNRKSSECLIARKKPDFDFSKEKKRPRLIGSDSGSSDEELEPPFRKRVSNGYDKGVVENSDVSGSEIKRSKLGVFEFDEYDAPYNSDDEAIEKSFFGTKTTTSGSKGDIVYKRKHSYFDRGSDYVNKRFETKKLRDASEEPIRVQGRNGVLKVLTSRKKKGSGFLKPFDHMKAGTSSRDTVKKNEMPHSPFYFKKNKLDLQKSSASKKNKSHNWDSDNSNSSPKLGKNKSKSKKTPAKKNSKALDWESDNSDTSVKLGPTKLEDHKPVKLVRSKEEATPPSGKILANRSNEEKIRRGSGTEKQKLREQIKKMLLDAGWTIDYRPRRNRDYQDAVYVNPSGTAYWSIVKAYDALQKQFGEEEDSLKPSGDYSSFSPISEDVISKLMRQTQRKMEKEMKRKQRDANGSKNAQERAIKRPAKYKYDSSVLKQKGKSWKVRTMENASSDSSDSTSKSKNEENYSSEDNLNGNSSIHGRRNRKLGRCTLVVRSSDKVQNSETDGYIPYTGKRTLLSWLIDSDTVGSSEKVQYMNRRQTRVMLEGWITRDGIHCGCCSKILTVTKFEIHAGSKLRQPYQNIYLESGISLWQCQMDAWNRQEKSKRSSFHSVPIDDDDPNDDTCGICGDGGDLICCDDCPSTFHQACLGIGILPTGDWHCPNCICKLCGMFGSSSSQGNEIAEPVLATCSLCERKYHQSCIQDVDALHIDSTGPSFCGKNCRELFEKLQKFIETKHDLDGGFSWSLIHRTDISDVYTSARGLTQLVECNSKLAVALTVMDECFLPIVDRRSGINLIRNVLYNCRSNFRRLNYGGFYTAILERGDEIIAAASLRFHGTQLAEMPFIGTRHIYRRQGMCNRLFRAIEWGLYSFKVEKLIIPAISELMHTWTEVFGFAYLEESQKEELRSISMLVFPGVDMLRKLLSKEESNLQNVITSTGEKSKELEGEPSFTADSLNKSSEDSGDTPVVGTDENVVASDSALQSSEVLLNDATLPIRALDTDEVKVSLSPDEIMCTSSQSEEKVPVYATGLKPIFSDDANNAVLERQDNKIQDSKDMDVTNGSSNNAASVEPVSHTVDNVSAQIATEADKNEDDCVFVSPFHENDENLMQMNSDLDSDKSRGNVTVVDSSGECAETRVCEMETASQLGNNLPEITNVFEVQTGSQSDDDMVNYDSKPKYVFPCNKNPIVSKMVDTHTDHAYEPSVQCKTGSEPGKSLCESASDSETKVLELHTKSQSDYEMEENASKPRCVSPCYKDEDAFKIEDTLAVDTSHKCAVSAVCEMGTECQLGENISESASDSRINVFKAETKSQSDDDFAENAPKPKCISSCNQNQYTSFAVDASLGGALQPSLEPETESFNDSVACVEPVLCFSEEIPTDNSTEAIDQDKKTTPFSDGINDSLTEA